MKERKGPSGGGDMEYVLIPLTAYQKIVAISQRLSLIEEALDTTDTTDILGRIVADFGIPDGTNQREGNEIDLVDAGAPKIKVPTEMFTLLLERTETYSIISEIVPDNTVAAITAYYKQRPKEEDSVRRFRKRSVYPLRDLFPDFNDIAPGEWSKHARLIPCENGKTFELGLYREEAGTEYEGTLTLQAFLGDDVILCETVSPNARNKECNDIGKFRALVAAGKSSDFLAEEFGQDKDVVELWKRKYATTA
jgi:hypothetical protein